jgi:hypothetical protein
MILILRTFVYLARIWKRADVLAELENDQLRHTLREVAFAAGMTVGTMDDLVKRVRHLRELEETRGGR